MTRGSTIVRKALYSLLFTCCLSWQVWAQPTVYIVRHAEKLAGWPAGELAQFQPLSQAGVERAKKLADYFKKIPLKAIYSSNTTRTLHTAFPLAQKLKLPIQAEMACQDTSAITDFLEELATAYAPDDAVLIVSHSNIIPYFLIKAGLPRACWKKLGLASPKDGSWILIKGYKNIWKISKLDPGSMDCSHFQRRHF